MTVEGVVAQAAALVDVFKEARAAGDIELADAIKSHIRTAERDPRTAIGGVTLVMPSGRRVPLANARAHIRRTNTPARPGSLADTMRRLSARCRKLASECDREKIAHVLACGARRSQPARGACPECASRLGYDGVCDLCGFGDDSRLARCERAGRCFLTPGVDLWLRTKQT